MPKNEKKKKLPEIKISYDMYTTGYRAFSLTWSVAMQIYCNKSKLLLKKKVQLPEDGFGTPT